MLPASRLWKPTAWFANKNSERPPAGGRFPEDTDGNASFTEDGEKR